MSIFSPPTAAQLNKKRWRKKTPKSIKEKFKQPKAIATGRFITRQAQIVLGTLLTALGFSLFQVPYNLAAGGVSGLGIILNHFSGIPVGTIVMVLNLPLLVLGFFQLGRWRFLVSTTLSVVCFSFSTDLFNFYLPGTSDVWPITKDLLLASIYAGVLSGIGFGIVQRAGGTLGGLPFWPGSYTKEPGFQCPSPIFLQTV